MDPETTSFHVLDFQGLYHLHEVSYSSSSPSPFLLLLQIFDSTVPAGTLCCLLLLAGSNGTPLFLFTCAGQDVW